MLPPYLTPRQGGPILLVVLWYGLADDVPLIQHRQYGLFKDGLMSNSYGVVNTSQGGGAFICPVSHMYRCVTCTVYGEMEMCFLHGTTL